MISLQATPPSVSVRVPTTTSQSCSLTLQAPAVTEALSARAVLLPPVFDPAGNPPKRFREGADDNVTDLLTHLQRMGTSARSTFLRTPGSKANNTFANSKGASASAIRRADEEDAAVDAKEDQA
jgi:hypothetical protein